MVMMNPQHMATAEITTLDRKILALLLAAKEDEASIWALSKRLDEPYHSVRSSLSKMEESGILQSRLRPNMKGVPNRLYTLTPRALEILSTQFEHGVGVLEHALKLGKEYPGAHKYNLILAALSDYSLLRNFAFPIPLGGLLDSDVKQYGLALSREPTGRAKWRTMPLMLEQGMKAESVVPDRATKIVGAYGVAKLSGPGIGQRTVMVGKRERRASP